MGPSLASEKSDMARWLAAGGWLSERTAVRRRREADRREDGRSVRRTAWAAETTGADGVVPSAPVVGLDLLRVVRVGIFLAVGLLMSEEPSLGRGCLVGFQLRVRVAAGAAVRLGLDGALIAASAA